MRVVEVTHGLGLGGAEVALASRLRRSAEGDGPAVATTVLNTCPRLDAMAGEVAATGADVEAVRLLSPLGFVRLVLWLRAASPDVVVLHSPTVVVTVLFARLLGLVRGRVVVVAHNEAARQLFHVLLPLVNPLADLHVAVSQRVAAAVQCRRARRVVVQYLGADPVDGGAAGPTGGPVFLSAGRHTSLKRVDLLLQAVSQAAPRLRKACAIVRIAGEGPESPMLRQLSRTLGIEDLVEFLGVVRPLDPLLASSDALVVSSDAEGLPIVVFEAMLGGLALISTDAGGAVEIIEGPENRIVPRGDVSALAAALSATADEVPELRASRARRVRAASRYATSETADAFYAALADARDSSTITEPQQVAA